MDALFEKVYRIYKTLYKSRAMFASNALIAAYFGFFGFLFGFFEFPQVKTFMMVGCFICLLFFIILYYYFHKARFPTDTSDIFDRPNMLEENLKKFTFQANRFEKTSKKEKDISTPAELNRLISYCDEYLSNKNTLEIFAIIIPLVNCFISGKSITEWIKALLNKENVNLWCVLLMCIITLGITIWMICSIIKQIRTMWFPSKRNTIWSLRRDLCFIRDRQILGNDHEYSIKE